MYNEPPAVNSSSAPPVWMRHRLHRHGATPINIVEHLIQTQTAGFAADLTEFVDRCLSPL
jgi:hypothetical protein